MGSLDLNISLENLTGWEEWIELNATLDMFGRDKKHLEGVTYFVILFCYVVIITIAGETGKQENFGTSEQSIVFYSIRTHPSENLFKENRMNKIRFSFYT